MIYTFFGGTGTGFYARGRSRAQRGPEGEFEPLPGFCPHGNDEFDEGSEFDGPKGGLDQTDGKRLGRLVSHQDHREVISARHVQFVAGDVAMFARSLRHAGLKRVEVACLHVNFP